MIKLTAAKANVAYCPPIRPGSTILVRPDEIITVEEIGIYGANGSYDGTRRGSVVTFKRRVGDRHDRLDLTTRYVEETPDQIAAKLDAAEPPVGSQPKPDQK